jgi:hypothetical protein
VLLGLVDSVKNLSSDSSIRLSEIPLDSPIMEKIDIIKTPSVCYLVDFFNKGYTVLDMDKLINKSITSFIVVKNPESFLEIEKSLKRMKEEGVTITSLIDPDFKHEVEAIKNILYLKRSKKAICDTKSGITQSCESLIYSVCCLF